MEKKKLEKLMNECIQLAKLGNVSPNPKVGAIIFKDAKIIGKGFHRGFGLPHAEIEAIKNAKTSVKNSTLIVNLEPCSHFGKTPPCVDEIIKQKISTVVIGSKDKNPIVEGIKKLQKANIKVVTGILEEKCGKLNEPFFKFITTKVPFVTLKIAQTLNGQIADINGNSKWISNLKSRKFVHKLRSETDAVLIGANTAIRDNPNLTTYLIKGKNPSRIIIDGKFKCETSQNVFKKIGNEKIFLFVSNVFLKKQKAKEIEFKKIGIEIISLTSKSGKLNLKTILKILGEKNLSSILVEGGTEIFSQFIKNKIADKILVFIAPKIFSSQKSFFESSDFSKISKSIAVKNITAKKLDNNILLEGYF